MPADVIPFSDFIPFLKRKSFLPRSIKPGFSYGNTISSFKGKEDPFEERALYDYTSDIKKLDWKLYARTRRWYIKTGKKTLRNKIYLQIDTSESFKLFPEKFHSARLLLLSLAWLALENNDLVYIEIIEGRSGPRIYSRISDTRSLPAYDGMIINQLNNLSLKKDASLVWSESIEIPAAINHIYRFTDLYEDMNDFRYHINAARKGKSSLTVFHIFHPEEKNNPKSLYLKDSENNEIAPNLPEDYYTKIWEESIKKRQKEIIQAGYHYVPLNAQKNPIDLFHQMEYAHDLS